MTHFRYWRDLHAVLLEHDSPTVQDLPCWLYDRFLERGKRLGVISDDGDDGDV